MISACCRIRCICPDRVGKPGILDLKTKGRTERPVTDHRATAGEVRPDFSG